MQTLPKTLSSSPSFTETVHYSIAKQYSVENGYENIVGKDGDQHFPFFPESFFFIDKILLHFFSHCKCFEFGYGFIFII